MSSCEPGRGEARLTLELDGHLYSVRGLAIGLERPLLRAQKALPALVRLMAESMERIEETRERRQRAGRRRSKK